MNEIRPIHTDTDYAEALHEIDELLNHHPEPGTPEDERLELISILVEDYERRAYPIAPPDDPVEVIRFYMDQKGLTRKDLEQYLGDRSRVSDILGRRRSLSLSMIRRLSQGLGIPADLLIAPIKTDPINDTPHKTTGVRAIPGLEQNDF
jgi:HTH-type transcriptional regulator / antitoxin HigA